MQCLNINLPEVVELSKALNLPPIIVAAKIQVWQAVNNTDSFPTVADMLQEGKVESILNKAGFKLTTLDQYQEATGKVFRGTKALVDFSKQMVALANNATVTDLYEEIGHIAVMHERNTPAYKLAINEIEKHPYFLQYYDMYFAKYDDDTLTREEILGKIITDTIKNRIEKTPSLFMRLWKKFLNLFKNINPADLLVDNFLNNTTEVKGTEVFFSLEESKQLLKSQVEALKKRLVVLRERGRDSKETIKQIESLEAELEKNINGVGIYKFLQHLEIDNVSALNFVEQFFEISKNKDRTFLGSRNTEPAPPPGKIMQLGQYIGYYRPFLEALLGYVDASDLPAGRKKILQRNIDAAMQKFDLIKRAYNQLLYEDGNRTIEESLLAQYPNMTLEEIENKLNWNWREALKVFYKDSNFMESWFGPIRNNVDTLNRFVHSLVFKLNNDIRNQTYDWANDFLEKAKNFIGKDMSWVFEYDSNRKKTGYWVDKTRYAEWEEARKTFHEQNRERYGFSQDLYERIAQKEEIKALEKELGRQIRSGNVDAAFQAMAEPRIEKLKAYNKAIATWYNENSTVIDDVDAYIKQRKATLTKEQFKLWVYLNLELNDDGTVKFYKGELTAPSDGSKKLIFNTYVKTVDWGNPDYYKLSPDQKAFLEYLRESKTDIDMLLPRASYRLVPQVYESMLDALISRDPEMFSRVKKNLSGIITKEEDDTEFVDSIIVNDSTLLERAPLRFTNKLKEPNRVSSDILSSMLAYKFMAVNFTEKSRALPQFENILQLSATRRLAGEVPKEGAQTYSFKSLKTFLEMQIEGKEKEDLNVTILGNKVNISKVVEAISNWVRAKNLGLNFITMTSNLISSKVNATIETLVGKHTTLEDSRFANAELAKLLPTILSSDGLTSVDLISRLMRRMGLGTDIKSLFNDLDKHVLLRNLGTKQLYYGYHIGDYFTKAVVMISVLHNYKQGPNNQFYTKKEAKALGLDLNNAPSVYEIFKSGGYVRKEMMDALAIKIKTLSSQIDGSLSNEDKTAIHQNAIFSMVALHRGWLFEGMSRRFKSKGYDFTLGEINEGSYLTVFNLIGKFFMSPDKLAILKNLVAKYQMLEPYQQENLKRVILELMMIQAFVILALFINGLADDEEEDLMLDLLAYQSNRALLEVSSFYNPAELINAVRDPIVPARDLELITNFSDLFNSELIEKGKYEGMSKRSKFLVQMIPGVKAFTILNDPSSTNEFLKNKPLRPIYDLSELLSQEED